MNKQKFGVLLGCSVLVIFVVLSQVFDNTLYIICAAPPAMIVIFISLFVYKDTNGRVRVKNFVREFLRE